MEESPDISEGIVESSDDAADVRYPGSFNGCYDVAKVGLRHTDI